MNLLAKKIVLSLSKLALSQNWVMMHILNAGSEVLLINGLIGSCPWVYWVETLSNLRR